MRQALVEPQLNEIIYEICVNNKRSQGLDLIQVKKSTLEGVIDIHLASV